MEENKNSSLNTEEENSTVTLPPKPRFQLTTKGLRACLVAVTVIMWVGGAFFFLIGVFSHNFMQHFPGHDKDLNYPPGFPVASIVIGLVSIFIALLLNYILLFPTKIRYYIFFVVLTLIFLSEAFYFIMGVNYGKTFEDVAHRRFETAMTNYEDGFSFNMELNLIQWMLKCCGAKNYKDWYLTTWAEGKMKVPESCCMDVKHCHNLEPVMVDDIYKMGCEKKLTILLKTQRIVLVIMVVLSVLIKPIAGVLTLALGRREESKVVSPKARRASSQFLIPRV